MLFNEPKLLKWFISSICASRPDSFSALQRAEIAEIIMTEPDLREVAEVSVLFNEPKLLKSSTSTSSGRASCVSVLFNEPKLLKFTAAPLPFRSFVRFSALQRAEIAEIIPVHRWEVPHRAFQCSSTSRNC